MDAIVAPGSAGYGRQCQELNPGTLYKPAFESIRQKLWFNDWIIACVNTMQLANRLEN